MAEQRNLKVSVENFGPVKDGEFELKPLTIFIGPNNSGKSYMALLTYAASKALSGKLHWPLLRLGRVEPGSLVEYSKELEEWLRKAYSQTRGRPKDLLFEDLPPNIQQVFRKGFEKTFSGLSEDLDEALRNYFGYEVVKDLVRAGGSQNSLSIRLNDWNRDPPFLSLRLEPETEKIQVVWSTPDTSSFVVSLKDLSWPFPWRRRGKITKEEIGFLFHPILTHLWFQFVKANGVPIQDAFYLPSARSGILQGWQAFASWAVQMMSRRWGLERIESLSLTGVTGDFIQILLERVLSSPAFIYPKRKNAPKMLRLALATLENQVFQGEVSLEETKQEQSLPRILYKSGSLQLPLHRTSSMVGELAPLDLWIKYLLDPGDFLIIDEPEAHLHPESQRLIGSVLVRLIRAGVRVLCTTHSSLILHQVTNHLLASGADPNARKKLGFTEDDLLKDEEVGVYLFDMRKDGTLIKPVPIEPGFGISEEEFVRVAEAMGDETYRLSVPPSN